MKEDLISIVVPIYNVEKYLDRCLNSIVNQTYTNLEIILVDDGSPDNCPAMCDEWAKKDSRIKAIHKKNAGLGMARNTGIDHATGEYICFFDSDDYVALDLVEKAYASIIKYHADTVIYGTNEVDVSGKITSAKIPRTNREFYSGDEVMDIILPGMLVGNSARRALGLLMSAWSQMYAMSIIKEKGWRFASERQFVSEDYYSLLVLYGHVHKVAIIQEALYYYCHNPQSLSRMYDSERYKKNCVCHSGMIDVCDQHHYPNKVREGVHSQYLGKNIYIMKMIIKAPKSYKEKKRLLQEIICDKYFRDVLFQINAKNENWQKRILMEFAKIKNVTMIFILIRANCLLRRGQ